MGKRCFHNPNRRFEIITVVDNSPERVGALFENGISVIGIDKYIKKYKKYNIVIAMVKSEDVEMQLKKLKIDNYRIAADIYNSLEVPMDVEICHDN